MGARGAALGTSLSTTIESVVLLMLFLKKDYRVRFGTSQWHFNFALFKKCFKVGLPQAIFYSLEIAGWSFFFYMMLSLGPAHMTISSICQSLSIFLSFFFDGLSRGLSAVAASFIGAKRFDLIGKLIKSACILQLLFSAVLLFVFIFDPQDIIKIFFSLTEKTFLGEWHHMFTLSLVYVFIYLFFEGIRWILSGLLTAAGDTLFLLITGSLSVWLFLLLPVYLIVVKNRFSVDIAWLIAAFYAAFLCMIYMLRIKQGKWKTIDLIAQEKLEEEKLLS
jgi:MATE family multidrug resistance protein